jgi:hypothetical protein
MLKAEEEARKMQYVKQRIADRPPGRLAGGGESLNRVRDSGGAGPAVAGVGMSAVGNANRRTR